MDPKLKDRVLREAEAHDSDSVLENSYQLKNRFSHIWSYPSKIEIESYCDSLARKMEGSHVLDYGCGWGEGSFKYIGAGASVTGIDISKKFIDKANESAIKNNINPDRYQFMVMDAHNLEFDDAKFDYVIGFGIIHHLEQDKALREIYRVLKKGGEALFIEPLADNPLLKLFRILTPAARTVDEMPLSSKDLKRYAEMLDWQAKYKYCGLIEAPVAMLTSLIFPGKIDNLLLKYGHKLEVKLRDRHILDSWNQYVLLHFVK